MKVGLVLEGGAMRGLFTAGVLDIMMGNNIEIDTIIGTSAGAIYGINYFSKQIGRSIRYTKKYCKDKRYISIRNLLLTGNIINKKFAYYDVPFKYDVFDNDKFLNEIKNNKKFIATVSNVKTGKPEYYEINDPIKDIEILRACSSIPLVSKIVKINNNKYLDGGVTDAIPIDRMLEENVDKIIIILTQPLDFIKTNPNSKKIKLAKIRYRRYKKFLDSMNNRALIYNKTLEKIKKLEKEKKVFVIRPDSKIDINVIERNEDKIQEVYEKGLNVAINIMDDLKHYLK